MSDALFLNIRGCISKSFDINIYEIVYIHFKILLKIINGKIQRKACPSSLMQIIN